MENFLNEKINVSIIEHLSNSGKQSYGKKYIVEGLQLEKLVKKYFNVDIFYQDNEFPKNYKLLSEESISIKELPSFNFLVENINTEVKASSLISAFDDFYEKNKENISLYCETGEYSNKKLIVIFNLGEVILLEKAIRLIEDSGRCNHLSFDNFEFVFIFDHQYFLDQIKEAYLAYKLAEHKVFIYIYFHML